MESEWGTIETSIGRLNIAACTREYFNITGPKGNPDIPLLLATVTRRGAGWEIDGEYGLDKRPAHIREELLRLGIEWAEAHPENFERAGDSEFRSLLSDPADFDEILDGLKSGQEDLKSILEEPEFKRRASPQLVRRIKNEAQRIRVMRLQIAGAARAIKTLAEKCLAQEAARPLPNP